jgi:hypothetical protein
MNERSVWSSGWEREGGEGCTVGWVISKGEVEQVTEANWLTDGMMGR